VTGLRAHKLVRFTLALCLAGSSAALLAACGSGANRKGTDRFGAERLAVTSGGTPFVAGVRGECGELVIARVGSGKSRQVRVDGEELGGDCVKAVTSMQASRAGVDVTAEVRRPSDSSFEDTSGTNWALVRVTQAGERDSGFGRDGVADDKISSSTATLPDGTVVSAEGTRLGRDGKELSRRQVPVDLVPGEAVIAASPEDRLLVAGQPRLGNRDHVEVAALTRELAFDPGFGEKGIARTRYSFPKRVEPVPGGGAMVLDLSGGLSGVNVNGRPQRVLSLSGVSAIAGSGDGVAIATGGRILLVGFGRSDAAAIQPPGAVTDLALGPRGSLLVLGRGTVTTYDRRGERLSSQPAR